MGDDLVAVEVEIHPFGGGAPFGAAHHSAPECACYRQIVDGEGEVERGEGHCEVLRGRAKASAYPMIGAAPKPSSGAG